MLKDPTLYKRLQQSLEQEFGSAVGELDIDALAKSPLLNAYISEGQLDLHVQLNSVSNFRL